MKFGFRVNNRLASVATFADLRHLKILDFSGLVTGVCQHVRHETQVGHARVATKAIDQFDRAFGRSRRVARLVFGQKTKDTFLQFDLIKPPALAVLRVVAARHK